ncbi:MULTISPECIES: TonB-dependent receptor [Phyllobacteriaceae]|jgi:iron complex outermembrane recepter protein|uniref:TonB-dependent receptor n=2 Tax=Pseudomonadota TaxID=1224 RepID=A0A1C2ECC0_9HYPH|nr:MULTISPECIES: TonB-dependent receptor [Mesorhizobium]MBN9237588.1 TonB-dependent receptor [Mesorhizobium sp.]MDQ0331786.1 iron complex outermembrane receptor protein [Mesorhizobium sp. YL-MeA3-2017]OCX24510.1 TonB-dependent receptor [Mesorhizobium hungaricum]
MQKLAIVSLLSSSILAGPAFAQDAQKPARGTTTTLDKIIITGRDDRSISTVAQSVQVIDRAEVETAVGQNENASDLVARLVPGYAPRNQTISGASETFRGRSVLIMVDGVPRNTPLRDVSRILATIDLDTVERVEVINGASSLYGAGATGGTINFITKRGTSDTPKVTVRTGVSGFTENLGKSAGPTGNVQVEGRSGDFDYFASASGNFSRTTYDGHGKEMASDAMLGQGGGDRTGWGDLSGVLGYENGSKRFEVSADWTYARQKPDWFTNYLVNPVAPNFTDPYTGEPLVEDSKYLTAKYTDSDFALGKLEVKAFYNDIFKQSPFTKFSRVNSQVYIPTNPARPTLLPLNRDPTASFNQTALEVQRTGVNLTINTPVDFVTQGSNLTWGVDYTFDNTTQSLLNGQDAIAPSTQNSVAAFAQAEVPVTERFRIQGGVRFEQFYLDVDNFKRPAAAMLVGSNLVALPAIDVVGGSFDYNAATFNAGAVFDITQELQAFGNFSQGYSLTDIGGFTRRAGLNTNAETCDAYGTSIRPLLPCTNAPDYKVSYADIAPEPQLVNNWEAGLRGDWGNVRGGVSAYLSTSDNGVSYDIAANRVSQQKERIWGFEANAEYDLTDMFTLGGSVGYVEGKYDANKDGKIGSNEYLPNNRIPTTYKGLAYVVTHFDNNLTLRTELEMFSGRDRIPTQQLDGAVLANIGVTKKFAGGQELNFAVRNLFDTYYINPTASATRGADVPGLGRTIAASFKVTF